MLRCRRLFVHKRVFSDYVEDGFPGNIGKRRPPVH